MSNLDARSRWLALYVLCLASLMIVLDVTIVGVALPSIKADLGFSDTSLAWVVNAYLLTYGGFLLLGGRLGDLYGHRRLFLIGISVFTLASLVCGLATSQGFLVVARSVQGVGGAVASAVSLSLMVNLFTDPGERAKAMGIFGFVAAGGGSIGVLLGGIITDLISWHWIFLVNVPIGVFVVLISLRLLPESRLPTASKRLDIPGAVTVTAALIIAVYAIVNGNEVGWATFRTLGLLGLSGALLVTFLFIETRSSSPLVPLRLLRMRNMATADVVGVLWAAAMFAWFFMSALYMQLVLGYSPLEIGLAFLPANLIMAALSIGLSAKLVMRFGFRAPLATGLGLAAAGLLLFTRAPVDGTFVVDILPSMILLGLGAGMAFNPVLLAAMSDVAPEEAGLASGIVNTSFMMGGAVGLAVLASIADSRTANLLDAGESQASALTGGYHLAFLVGALFALSAAAIGGLLLRNQALPAHEQAPVGSAGTSSTRGPGSLVTDCYEVSAVAVPGVPERGVGAAAARRARRACRAPASSPSSTTATRSASCAVCSRCAIATTVRPSSTDASERSRWRAARGSSSEVASSSTSVCGSASTSRASASCCACAGVSGWPPAPTTVSSSSGSASHPVERVDRRERVDAAARPSRSGRASRRFSASVPTKTCCSCVTSATSCRSVSSGRSTSRTPPTSTRPSRGGWMPASRRPSVDLPAPDGPTTATRSPGSRSRSMPCRTSRSATYA